jgi:hypothetical protein
MRYTCAYLCTGIELGKPAVFDGTKVKVAGTDTVGSVRCNRRPPSSCLGGRVGFSLLSVAFQAPLLLLLLLLLLLQLLLLRALLVALRDLLAA